MATNYISATDAILSTFKVAWDANAGAVNNAVVPTIVYEATEPSLKPNPADGTVAWVRVVIRHNPDARKASLTNSEGLSRYRRTGTVWAQMFVPYKDAASYTVAQRLAVVAQKAYEGKRAAGGEVVFTSASVVEQAPDGPWVRFDCKATFYWDEVK